MMTPARRPFRYPHAAMAPAFYRAAVPPQAPFHHPAVAAVPPPPLPIGIPVRQVWAHNLDTEMDAVLAFATRAVRVAVNVQYPGVVHGAGMQADPGALAPEKRYAFLKANVDALKPLQLGLAVATDDGRCLAWEFNLAGFDRDADPHATRSVAYLAGRGMDLDAHRLRGVPAARLTMALHHCGLLRRPGLAWVTYAGAYHVAYLMKIVTGGRPLPGDVAGFVALVQRFLGGDVHDVARMAGNCPGLPIGLERIAGALGLAPPLGSAHLAGARAVVAMQVFFALGSGFGRGLAPLI
ncbi:hypothetical protein EJB05_42420, partial [Eragrostis curvula]